MEFLLTVAGCVLFVEGMPYFLSPNGVKKAVTRITAMPEATLRIIGFSLMVAGLLLVYWGRGAAG